MKKGREVQGWRKGCKFNREMMLIETSENKNAFRCGVIEEEKEDNDKKREKKKKSA